MEQIGKYTILQQIEETRGSKIYRAQETGKQTTVIIKALKVEYPSPSDIARFQQEYELIRNVDLPGIVRYIDLVDYGNGVAIVLEDFNGLSLKRILRVGKFNVQNFLSIAISVSKTLGELHARNIVHKDIKPHNILFEERKNIVKLTDFGISRELTRENQDIYNEDVIEGTLTYMSPEQTGRMNRSVDYRTDIYSLGVTFYEMLTGLVPFPSRDPMEIIHAHIAQVPDSPTVVDDSIPEVLSQIIMKQLSKTAEERYQNCFGLAADLEECERQYSKNKRIRRFNLAQKDISLKFNIPQVLIGREHELEVLMDSFERVGEGEKEIMLVAGHPGIGKSALIHEVHKPILAKRGYFLSGKFEEFRRDVPYSAIIQAFLGLVRQILAESEERIAAWRAAFEKSLGTNGKVIADVIPELSHIIGPQPDVPELGPEEAQHRFNHVFKNFVRVFATAEHPIVIFLDDMQWADSSSIRLINALMSDTEIGYVLLIMAYRSNEVDDSHAFVQAMEKLKKQLVTVHDISLEPLGEDHVTKLICNFLRCFPEQSGDLSALVHKKTGGNPFFINQFLKTIYEDHHLVLEPASGWKWDIEAIGRMQVTDNVVELMAQKISKLSEEGREILKICSCIGNRFDLETLAIITDEKIDSTLSKLTEVIEEGLVHRTGQLYHFHHDRIQEAAYSLIPQEMKARMHYNIGRHILENTDDSALSEKVLYIVHQLNAGRQCIESNEEKQQLRKLNLLSAAKARASAAYASTYHYLKVALEYVDEDAWQENYKETFDLYVRAAEAAYLTTNYKDMERFSETALKNSKSTLEMVRVYSVRINTYMAQNRITEAMETGLEILQKLGIKLPKRPSKWQAGFSFLLAKLAYRGRSIESFSKLPFTDDPHFLAIQKVFSSIGSVSYFVNINLWIMVLSRSIRLSLIHGNTPMACYTYAAVGSALCFTGDISNGYKFGKVGLEVGKKNVAREYQQRTQFAHECYIHHFKKPLSDTLKPLLDTHQMALDVGDLEFAALALMVRGYHLFLCGRNLEEVEKELASHIKTIHTLNHRTPLNLTKLCYQAVVNLRGDSKDPCDFEGKHFDERTMKPLVLVALYKLINNYIFCRYDEALENTKKAKRRINAVRGTAYEASLYLFESLTLTAKFESFPKRKKKAVKKKLAKNLRKLKKWADHAPENCLHKYYLVKGELARLRQDPNEALNFYDQAIIGAKDAGYHHEESIARELAARLFIDLGKEDIAKLYVTAAYYNYIRWGATAKVQAMDEQYADYIVRTNRMSLRALNPTETIAGHTVTMGMTNTATLDLNSILKAGQTIASEIDLDRLLKKVIQMAIENAGAQKGYLIMTQEGQKGLFVEAEGSVEEGARVLRSIPLQEMEDVPSSIVNYVNKTQKEVVLHNALYDERFMHDPCIIKNEVRSVLCAPIVHSGRAAGIIYLENNLSTNAFTHERLEVMQILYSQAAISIENSRLLAAREDAARLETELRIAANIQMSLVPRTPRIDHYQVTGFMMPAEEVGGDYYDVINGEDVDWAVIGDVSGHGVPAGLIMMMVQTCTQLIIKEDPKVSPRELLRKINIAVCHNLKMLDEKKYMTLNALAIYPDGRIVHAGLHQDILIFRRKKNRVEEVETHGIWIGLDAAHGVLNEDREFEVDVGDVILLYTDGVTEAIDKEGLMFGSENLKAVLQLSGQRTTMEIKEEILKAIRKHKKDDDVSMLVLKRIS